MVLRSLKKLNEAARLILLTLAIFVFTTLISIFVWSSWIRQSGTQAFDELTSAPKIGVSWAIAPAALLSPLIAYRLLKRFPRAPVLSVSFAAILTQFIFSGTIVAEMSSLSILPARIEVLQRIYGNSFDPCRLVEVGMSKEVAFEAMNQFGNPSDRSSLPEDDQFWCPTTQREVFGSDGRCLKVTFDKNSGRVSEVECFDGSTRK